MKFTCNDLLGIEASTLTNPRDPRPHRNPGNKVNGTSASYQGKAPQISTKSSSPLPPECGGGVRPHLPERLLQQQQQQQQQQQCGEVLTDTPSSSGLTPDRSAEYFFASDPSAIVEHTRRVIFLEVTRPWNVTAGLQLSILCNIITISHRTMTSPLLMPRGT